MNTKELKQVDHTAIKTNQAVIFLLNVLAFILDAPWLAGLVSLVMILGTLLKSPGFGLFYKGLRSIGLLKSEILMDHPQPHRFAQGFGGVVMLAGTIGLLTGAATLGWSLVWLVTALAALNLFGGFCVGCAVYYWLSRVRMPGFTQSPPEGTFPGRRPDTKVNYDQ